MKTPGIILIFLFALPLGAYSQALPNLAELRLGDSFEVEVLIENKKEQLGKGIDILYTRTEKEIFYYFLMLEKVEAGSYHFSSQIRRFRSRYDLVYTSERDKKRDEHRSFDSDFDIPGYPDRKELDFLNQSFTLIVTPEKFTHRIVFKEENRAGRSYVSTVLNPMGIPNHVNALFFVNSQPVNDGNISARIIPPKTFRKVYLSGQISQPLSQKLHFSANQGFGAPAKLSAFDKEVMLNDEGKFTVEYEINEARFIYLFHFDQENKGFGNDKQVSFPIYIEPGDEVELFLNTVQPDSLSFKGQNSAKYRSFHQFAMAFLGTNADSWQRIVPFTSPNYRFDNMGRIKSSPIDLNYETRRYNEILRYLEGEKSAMGESLYQRLKAETVFSFARKKLASKNGSLPGLELDDLNIEGLSLSGERDHHLDKFGLDLASVISSQSYSDFLKDHLYANMQLLHSKDIVQLPGRMQSYHFVRFAYRDFALLSLMKKIILDDLKVYENSLGFSLNSTHTNKPELALIIQDFLSICNYQPYVDEVKNELGRIEGLQKGNEAPDMHLDKDKRLSDYLGEKIILILFRKMEDPAIQEFKALQKQYPELKFIFVNTNPFKKKFEDERKDKAFPTELYHSPGYGYSEERPYLYSGFRNFVHYMIDQDGKLWGSASSIVNFDVFEHEIGALDLYQPNGLIQFYERRKKTLIQAFWWISGIFNLYLIYFLFYLRPKRKREIMHRERIETELRAIRSQMNPHFLFNSLSSVQNLINQADPERANYYLSRFSQLVRKVLNHSEQAMVPLADELKVVDLYCELEALRFKFEYQIETDPSIDVQLTEVPSMLIQPYVENAVRHGIAMQGGSGMIRILVKEEAGFIRVEIEDNGMGIRKHMQEVAGKKEKSGFGLRLSEERIEKINERYKLNIVVAIYDRRDDAEVSHGTRVVIKIPQEV
ncbi:MAG: histidine kinase [Bacteroidia bacterium]|nr:histidine kinase [Bacteroidia bacterium]